MTTFSITPGVPYTIGVTQPEVAGSPTPSISYEWTFDDTPIGSSRFVASYVFAANQLPGTLRCTITLSNVAGTASRTLEASVTQAVQAPSLQRVTIRDAASPASELTSISNDSSITLLAAGPSPADLTPVGQNYTSLTYQWLRDGEPIADQTAQTYALALADNDSTIAVQVTVSDGVQVASRTASVTVGESQGYIGGHMPPSDYSSSEVAFTNLVYQSFKNPFDVVRGNLNSHRVPFGAHRYLDWTGPAYYTADGWPFRNDNGAISTTTPARLVLCWAHRERMWSILGLRGQFDSLPIGVPTNENATAADYEAPTGIRGRQFKYDATCYWEGQGAAVVGGGKAPSSLPSVSTVEFTGPDGQGPFGDGPRTMKRSVVTFGASVNSVIDENFYKMIAYILASDSTGVDPLRNLVVLISNVRDAVTNELLYAGFDHTSYRPFQLYPDYVERMQPCAVIRSLKLQMARTTPTADNLIHEDTGLTYEWHNPEHGSTPLLTTGWSRASPSAPGFERGFAALNRPTNACFGGSLRACIELCNQLDADLWWCHPPTTVFVGTRNGSSITYARQRGRDINNPNQVGTLLADEEYAQGFADEIQAHLKPGLKVYLEFGNEIWNPGAWYVWGSRYAWTSGMRTIASVEYGGDGGLWYENRTLESPAVYAGTELKADGRNAMTAFAAAASALLAEKIRQRVGPEANREFICVGGVQSKWFSPGIGGYGQFWAAMPKLFKQMDAVTHAAYRSWWGNGAEYDAQLEAEGAEGIWSINENVRGTQRPYANLQTLALRSDSWWATEPGNYPTFLFWKHLVLDEPQGSNGPYNRQFVPPGWPPSQRRWNLKLLVYEGGNHHIPQSVGAKLQSFAGTVHPAYREFMVRYMETTFAPGPKGLTRDPANETEEALYRPGMVPMGIAENAEPLHDLFTFLSPIQKPDYANDTFWGMQWWNGHVDAPQVQGTKDAIALGIGKPDWWLTYEGDV